MLSLHTNTATLSAQNAVSRTQTALSTSQTRLSTGLRINSAMDDAAGLQIATRLKYQTSGMTVAMRNTQNSISMMQTAEGALDETTNILTRMKDLATQAADGSSTDDDKKAMQAEFNSLTSELSNIIGNTTFGGSKLFASENGETGAAAGKLATGITFQIGASKDETMTLDLTGTAAEEGTTGKGVAGMTSAILLAAKNFKSDGSTATAEDIEGATELVGTEDAPTSANSTIDALAKAIDAVGEVRSSLGAASNRLDHVYNNLANISTNTQAASGRIMDVDFASESANMTSSQMLLQAGTAMLKQSNSQSSLVMSLLQ